MGNVEFVYCCRNAGIAAAKSGDWIAAEYFFQLGAEKAKRSSIQKSMGIGLMADEAFALWKQKKYGNSLSIFADVLDLLGSITVSDDIRIRHLHATVRHSISWIHFDARNIQPADLVEPLPGMCSNQEPHEGIKDHRIIDISGAWELLASTELVLDLEIGIRAHSQAVTGGKKSLLMAGYERSLAFDLAMRGKDFTNLVPMLIELFKGLHNSKTLEESHEDGWAIADIPELPDGYWNNFKSWDSFYHFMLVASVISTADSQVAPLPIERWRADLANIGALPDEVDQFLNVLNGAVPNDSFYQRAAAAIFALRSDVLAPVDLWRCTFLLLNACVLKKQLVVDSLEKLLIARWFFATNNQRFAFTTPSLACAEIERCWLDKSLSGLSKVAAVLLIAAPYLNFRLSAEISQRLKKIIRQEM